VRERQLLLEPPDELVAPCPKHGEARFVWICIAEWWMCSEGMSAPLGGRDPNYCSSVVTYEEFVRSPDGGRVEQGGEVARRPRPPGTPRPPARGPETGG
jgi:hypothetical protein